MAKDKQYLDNFVMCAERLSRSIEESFVKEFKNAELFLPGDSKDDAALQMIEIFIEYLVGTSVAISSHYVSTENDFEEFVVDLVRDKFSRLKQMDVEQRGESELN